MEIHFDKSGHIVGARTENYLLEKSRVTFQVLQSILFFLHLLSFLPIIYLFIFIDFYSTKQTEGERNYHIFYMLCVGSHCSTLGLSPDMNTYRYLNSSGCLEVFHLYFGVSLWFVFHAHIFFIGPRN